MHPKDAEGIANSVDPDQQSDLGLKQCRPWSAIWSRSALFAQTYRKIPKYSDTPKIWTMWLYHSVMSPNDADGMANSVDPDQPAPLIWVCTVCPGISVQKLRITTVPIWKLRIITVDLSYDTIHVQMSLVKRKPVFGVLDQGRFKPACAATEARKRLNYYLCSEQQRHRPDWADMQANLRLCCSHMA